MNRYKFLIGLVVVISTVFVIWKLVGFELAVLWILANIYWEVVWSNVIKESTNKKDINLNG